MRLTVKRRFRGPDYTIGSLYVGGEYFCDTLEDPDRGLKKTDPLPIIKSKKVYGETAIPAGTYPVTVNLSPRFRRNLPRLMGVPGFEGILIHSGNTAEDTSGCILVGENKQKGKVLRSRYWEQKLMEVLKGKTGVTITIE